MKEYLSSFRTRKGFSLVEVLVSCAVLSLIMLLLISITGITSKTWKGTTEKMQAFEESRAAFDRITSLLAQATLNPYWDYYPDNQNPTKYQRTSELQFLSLPMAPMLALLPSGQRPADTTAFDANTFPSHGLFFQAPTGKIATTDQNILGQMPLLLNAYGYFIEYGPDDRPTWLPSLVSAKNRFRLKEWRVPSENWLLYANTSGATGKSYLGATSYGWINLANPAPKTLAENVVALVIYPKSTDANSTTTSTSLAEADTFVYNSRTNNTPTTPEGTNQKHQLPPEVEVIMVAIDETSASRTWNNANTAPTLTTGAALFQAPKINTSDTTPTQMEADLTTLTTALSRAKIKYIVLRSTVKIRGARWTQN